MALFLPGLAWFIFFDVNRKIWAGDVAQAASDAVIQVDDFHYVIALLVHLVCQFQYIFWAVKDAQAAALANRFIDVHEKFLHKFSGRKPLVLQPGGGMPASF
jgi:hypothetical protein